jgi:hypothetical protein
MRRLNNTDRKSQTRRISIDYFLYHTLLCANGFLYSAVSQPNSDRA